MILLSWLLCFILALIPAYFLFRKDRKKNIPVKWLPAFLRFLTIFFTLVLFFVPEFETEKTKEEKPIIVWLQDQSGSISKALSSDSNVYINNFEKLKKEWEKDYNLISLGFGTQVEREHIFHFHQKSTNISQALQQVIDQYENRNLSAIILASDGNYNEGINPLHLSLNNQIPIYTIGLGDSSQIKDVLVSRVYANKKVALHSDFEIIADIQALKMSGLKTDVSLIHKGKALAKSPVSVNNDDFSKTVKFEVNADEKGFQKYTIGFPHIATEENLLNNQQEIFIEVIEESLNILILAASPHPDIQVIRSALSERKDYKIEIKYAQENPSEFEKYDLIIAHQIPNTGVSLENIHKPIWYILGNLTHIPTFNKIQDWLHIDPSVNTNAVLPVFQKEFNAFTIPVKMESVLGQFPPLNAPSGNYKSSGNIQVLFRQKIGSIETNYPLWYIAPSEIPQAVLTGTGIWRWRMMEFKNHRSTENVDELIRQTVSMLRTDNRKDKFKVYVNDAVFSDNEPISIFGELRNENSELVNTANVQLEIRDSTGKKLNYEFEKQGNSYYLNIGLLSAGSYSFAGTTNYNNQSLESKGIFQVNSIDVEDLKSYADFRLLFSLAKETDAAFFTMQNMNFLTDSLKNNKQVKPLLYQEKSYSKLIDYKWYFFFILFMATAEWLLRKYWGI